MQRNNPPSFRILPGIYQLSLIFVSVLASHEHFLLRTCWLLSRGLNVHHGAVLGRYKYIVRGMEREVCRSFFFKLVLLCEIVTTAVVFIGEL